MSLDIYSIVISNSNFYITIITTSSLLLLSFIVLVILYTVFMYSINKNCVDYYIDENVYELLEGLALLHSDFILEFNPKIKLTETQFSIYIKMYMLGVNNKIQNIFFIKVSNLLKINKQSFQPPELLKY